MQLSVMHTHHSKQTTITMLNTTIRFVMKRTKKAANKTITDMKLKNEKKEITTTNREKRI